MTFTRALVTGASVGIGRALAAELASRGTALVLVARDEERLTALGAELTRLHGVAVEVLPADLTVDADRRRVEQRVASPPDVDVVVNNAGLGTYGPLAGSSPDAEQPQVEVNVTALTRLTTVAAQVFSARRHGGIMNVSSLAGFQPNPGHATYGATKAYVTSLTEAVHEELRADGVHVTALCPGYTRTEFHDRADWQIGGLPDAAWSTSEEVARVGVDALEANRAIAIPGGANKVMSGLSRALPSTLTRRSAALITRLGGSAP